MQNEIGKTKEHIRQIIKLSKARISNEQRKTESDDIMRQLEKLDCFKKAHTILLYHSLPDEVDTTGMIKRWNKTKQIILPVVSGNDLILRRYSPEHLSTGVFGIREPDTNNEQIDLSEVDLAIIPGIAFDSKGNRLGRGNGYYDRLLQEKNRTTTIGICFRLQLIESIPANTFDQPMNKIATADKIYHCDKT